MIPTPGGVGGGVLDLVTFATILLTSYIAMSAHYSSISCLIAALNCTVTCNIISDGKNYGMCLESFYMCDLQ